MVFVFYRLIRSIFFLATFGWFCFIYFVAMFYLFQRLGFINMAHPVVAQLQAFIRWVTDPLLYLLRQHCPFLVMGSVDWSPVALLMISYLLYKMVSFL